MWHVMALPCWAAPVLVYPIVTSILPAAAITAHCSTMLSATQRELATLRSATEKHKGLAAELEAGTHEGLRVPHSVRWLEACRAAK